MSGIRYSFLSGVKHVAFAKYSNVVVNLVIGSILARVLSPEEYGIVAIVAVFIVFFGMLSGLGLSAGVVQFRDLTDRQLASLFNFSIVIGLVLAGCFLVFSYWIAAFYGDDVYITIGQFMCLSVFFKSVSAIPQGLLQRAREFKMLGLLNVGANITSGIVGIVLALEGYSYWALVIRTLVSAGLLFVLMLCFSRTPIALALNIGGLSSFARYSGFTFLFDFVNYFSRNLDNILIAKFMGPPSLGVYDKAYTLMKMPLDNLTYLISPVLHPLLTDSKINRDKIFLIHTELLNLLCVVGLFISVFCYYASDEIIVILYGHKWIESATPFKWLSLSIWIQIALSSTGPFFLSSGKTKFYFVTGLISAFVIIGAITLGIAAGSIERVAIYLLISFCFNLFQCYFFLYRFILRYPYLVFIKAVTGYFVVGAIGFISLFPLGSLHFDPIPGIFIKLAVLIIAFSLALLITGRSHIIRLLYNLLVGRKLPIKP